MIPKLDECEPGLRPLGYNVLIAPDTLEEKTAGGVILPARHREREDGAVERGLVVCVSEMAFKGGDWEGCKVPEPGDVVLFQRYSGKEFEGADGRKYMTVPDAELKGVFA